MKSFVCLSASKILHYDLARFQIAYCHCYRYGCLWGGKSLRGYDTVDGRRAFGVVFPILTGRQLRIHYGDSEWSFSTNRTSVTRITMAQIEIKWDLITKT